MALLARMLQLMRDPATLSDRVRAHSAWLRWKLSRRPVKSRLGPIAFEFDFALSPYVRNINFGWYQEEIVHVLRTFLKPGDVFLDVGANIGYMSAMAAGIVGRGGEVHAFEPAPPYFARLKRFADMNPAYTIRANPFALGDEEGNAHLVLGADNIGINTVHTCAVDGAVEIAVRRLDAYIDQHISRPIALIKIDVETFEFPVLRGLSRYLDRARPVMICEIFPKEYEPARLAALAEFIAWYGYTPYDVKDLTRRIDIREGWRGGDAVLLPA